MTDNIKKQLDDYYDFWFGMNNLYEMWSKRHNLSYYSLFVLYIIKKKQGECTQKMICTELLLPKQTVNTILNSFENLGYIKKTIDENNKRNKFISYTEKGEIYSNEILDKLFEFEEKAMKKMTPKQRVQMAEINSISLKCFEEAFDEMYKQGGGD